MNTTFRKVAAFCGLRLSYYTTAALLAVIFLALIPTAYISASPLYILLTLAVLPSVVKAMFFTEEKNKKKEYAPAYPLFCKKFRYDFIAYKAMNVSYLLLFVLFAAWHISCSSQQDIPALLQNLPVLLACISLLIRIFAVLGYLLYFRFFPLHAMR